MNALKILFLLPLSILSFKMTAQIDDLLKNKDITWIAETYNDFLVDESLGKRVDKNTNYAVSLKFVNQPDKPVEEKLALHEWLFNAFENGKVSIFEDEFCTKPRSSKVLWSADSVTFIDPITYKSRVEVVVNKPNFEYDSPLFRAKQVIFYNAKKAQFGMRTLAIAPIYVYKEYDHEQKVSMSKREPLFWFKPQDLNKTQRLSKKNITWAKRMSFVNGLAIHSDSVKILKKVADNMPLAHLFSAVKTNRRLPFYKNETGIEPRKKIPFEERKNMFSRNDTLRILDPLTYTESYKMITEETKPSDCESLQLIQNWYWNDRKKRLEIYLVATAPLKDSYFGGYKMPLFYCRTDD